MAGAGGHVPQAIVLALGVGALGGADALRLLLHFAGRISPAVDLAICVVAITLLTAPLLGIILLARFVLKVRPGGATAPPTTDLFGQLTAAVSAGAAILITACLLVVPATGGGIGGAVRLPIDLAVIRNPIVVTVLAICAAFACAVHLRDPATTIKVVAVFMVAVSSSLVASFVASGGFDAHGQLFFPEFHRRRRMVTMPVGLAIVAIAVTALLVRCSRRARNPAGAGGGAAARTSRRPRVPSSPSPAS